jgi:crotonobetainyl-CoA:carnitine CoA-transferase CaiB-like acyl-CoA transferase
VEALRAPGLACADSRRLHDKELAEALGCLFRSRAAADWERLLVPADIGCVQVHEGSPERQMRTDPELVAEYAGSADSPVFGDHIRMGPAVRFSRSRTRTLGGCLPGDHTDALLREFGHDDTSIADLRSRGVVG